MEIKKLSVKTINFTEQEITILESAYKILFKDFCKLQDSCVFCPIEIGCDKHSIKGVIEKILEQGCYILKK